jgi:hypothetical protein
MTRMAYEHANRQMEPLSALAECFGMIYVHKDKPTVMVSFGGATSEGHGTMLIWHIGNLQHVVCYSTPDHEAAKCMLQSRLRVALLLIDVNVGGRG